MSYSRSASRSGSRSASRSPDYSRKRNHSPAPRSRGRYGGGSSGHDDRGSTGTGFISSLNERGFGFISPADDQDDNSEIYFHCTALGRSYPFDDLREGDEVEYEYIMDHKKNKPRAKSVKFLTAGSSSRSSRKSGGGRRGRSRSKSRSYERGRGGRGGGRDRDDHRSGGSGRY